MKKLKFDFETTHIPSVNDTYVRGKNGVFKKDEVKSYQLALGYYALREAKKEGFFLDANAKISVKMIFSVKNIHRDLDNMIKSTLDALQGVLFRNDSQVYRIEVSKKEAKNKENVQIEITEI